MSNQHNSKQSIIITKPTYEQPFIHVSGKTYPLRTLLRKDLEFDWKGDKKLWEKELIVIDGITTNDLQNTALPIIDQITTEASFEGIQVHINNNNNITSLSIDYNIIKNINNIYPDGSKIIDKYMTKYYDNDGQYKPDKISTTLNIIDNTIEFQGSTYYNKEWLKTTLNAQWDKDKRVWYIKNGNNDILKQINRILDEFGIGFGVSKLKTNHNNNYLRDNYLRYNDRNVNKKINSKRLKRRYISDEESDSDEYFDNNNKCDNYIEPALKRRRIIESDSDNDMNNGNEKLNENNLSFVVSDDIIEYEDDVSDRDSDSDINSEHDSDSDYVLPKSKKDIVCMSQDNVNVNVDIDEKKDKKDIKVDMSQDIIIDNNDNDKKQDINIDNECVICMDGRKQYLCNPCGHLCLCMDCKDTVQNCPMCRAKLVSVIKLFK
eukprot:184928_1